MNYKLKLTMSVFLVSLSGLGLRCEASGRQDQTYQEAINIANSYSYENMPDVDSKFAPRTRDELLGDKVGVRKSNTIVQEEVLFDDSDSTDSDLNLNLQIPTVSGDNNRDGSFDTQHGTILGDDDL